MRRSCSPRRPVRAPAAVAALAAVAAVIGAGCLDDEMDPLDPGNAAGFIAYPADFQSFRSWPNKVEVGTAEVVGGHDIGPRIVYMNQPPSGGEFAVGAILVKAAEVDMSNPESWQIHARVKRGSGVNAQGAIDWEWFSLQIKN